MATASRRPRHRLRRAAIALAALVVLLMAGVFGLAWYFSNQLLDVSHAAPQYPVTVLASHGRSVTLSRESGFADAGRFGLEWRGGQAQVGPVIARSGRGITRPLLSSGSRPAAGAKVKYSVYFYRSPHDVGLSYRSITYPDPVGRMPAWLVPGRGSTWIISVHGLESTRAEPVRSMPVFTSLGMPVLDIGYRNDAGAPQDGDHLYHLGSDEWIDLQAAVTYALHHGARAVVLNGYSMGGSIVETFMQQSPEARRVKAVILDAPALDWYAILNLAASQRNLPGVFAAIVERVIAFRIGLTSLDSLDFVDQKLRVPRPTLLFQGTADTLVPPSSNRAFAAHHPGLVRYVSVPGADHVQSWNVKPRVYDATLRRFLLAHLRCRRSASRTTCT